MSISKQVTFKRQGMFTLTVREQEFNRLSELKKNSNGKSYADIIADLLNNTCGGACVCQK